MMRKVRQPFITGSQIYGTPTEESDIDLVVEMSSETVSKLIDIAGLDHPEYDGPFITMRFGKLNLLICIYNPNKKLRKKFREYHPGYKAWWKGTKKLIEQRPVTRQTAVDLFQKLFRKKQNATQKTTKKETSSSSTRENT